MSELSSSNKRIAKNTLLLYFRMFITMLVGLYTSRVVLNVLGVSDFGIYNVVGGIITMASFLNVAMVQASQRFISFELGLGNIKRLNKVFCSSVNIHFAICVIAVILGETVGLWFVNSKLNIPEGRMEAANWVYQASILSFVVGVMSVPYNSAIVAHEKMSAFAYISILEVSLKLLIVYLLLIIPFDKLIVFGVLMVMVSIIIRLCYTVYCKRHFIECSYHFVFDKKISNEMLSFAGWSVIGNLGFSFKDQVSNIILNLFYGTTVNAARGIGLHVTSLINTFALNFTMAINPQITKQYAVGDIESSKKLVYAGSRYSFYLLSIIAIPVLINIDYLLKFWLGIVPEYCSQFVIFSLLTSLLYAMSGCVTIAIQATGRMKWFQIGISVIQLSELPIAWFLMELGYPPFAVMWPSILTSSIAVVFRFWLLQNYVPQYRFRDYLTRVLFRCIALFGLSFFISNKISLELEASSYSSLISFCLSLFITILVLFLFGISSYERKLLISKIAKIRYGKL